METTEQRPVPRPSAPEVRDKQVRTAATRAELLRRRHLAESATPGPWFDHFTVHGDPSVVTEVRRAAFTMVADISTGPADYGRANAWFIAANDPRHALAVLDAHSRLLDTVALHSLQCDCPVCLCVDALLDIYAPG